MKQKENLDIMSTVEIEFSDLHEIRPILAAINPDNVNFPDGLYVEMISSANKIIIKINCKIGMRTFINTLDEILEHISVAKAAINDD